MSRLASVEKIVIKSGQETGGHEVKNRLVMLIERHPGRIIHGQVLKTPEDAVLQTMETGLQHAAAYHIQPPQNAEASRPLQPSYLILANNVLHLETIDEMPAQAVTRLTPEQVATYE